MKKILQIIAAASVLFPSLRFTPTAEMQEYGKTFSEEGYEVRLPEGWVVLDDILDSDRKSFARARDIHAGLNFPWPMVEIQKNDSVNRKNFHSIVGAIDEAIENNAAYRGFDRKLAAETRFMDKRGYNLAYFSQDKRKLLFVRAIENEEYAYIIFSNLDNERKDMEEVFSIMDSFSLIER